MKPIRFNADKIEYLPGAKLTATDEQGNKPWFGVRLLLAVLNKKNGNGHKLILEDAKQAIAWMDDKPIPGSIDHEKPILGASIKVWLEKEDTDLPELWLEGVYWKREISEENAEAISAAFNEKRLGASWEIDIYKSLDADTSDESLIVREWQLTGFTMVVRKEPAERQTKGQVQIAATKQASDLTDIAPPVDYIVEILRYIRCPVCGNYWVKVVKADFETGQFDLICFVYDDDDSGEMKEKHRFTLTLDISASSQKAIIQGGADDMAAADKKEDSMEQNIGEAIAQAIAEREKTWQALDADKDAKHMAEMEAAIAKAKKEEREELIASFKAAARKVEEFGAVKPYESKQAEMDAYIQFAGMNDEEFARMLEAAKGEKEVIDLKTRIAELEKQLQATQSGNLPMGKEGEAKPENSIDFDKALAALDRM